MSNALIAFNNLVGSAALSGGSYYASLPLANLKTRRMKEVARSVDLSLTSTQMLADLGPNSPVQLVGLVGHNFSLSARYRIRGSNDVTFATSDFDSGWKDVWPTVYASMSVPWQSANWFSGKYTDFSRQGFTWNITEFLPRLMGERYWLFEIDDHVRTDVSYVQFGRAIFMTGYQPVVNMSPGADMGWNPNTDVQQAMSGAEYFQRRAAYRSATFSTDYMLDDEAFGSAFDIERIVGIDGELYFMRDPQDTLHAPRTQFLGRLSKTNSVKMSSYLLRGKAWDVKELL